MKFVYSFIARFLVNHPRVTDWLLERAKRTPYTHISSRDGTQEYMRRWWLFNPYVNEQYRRKYNWIPMSIRFHEILLRDDDGHLHDHPWDAQTMVLRGWYVEQREVCPLGISLYTRTREPGYTGPLRFGEFHRITAKSIKPVLTLFITFKYGGTWGFKVNGKKVPWYEHLGESASNEASE